MSQFYSYPPAPPVTASNPSVGVNGAPAPASSTEIGFIDASGNEAGVSATNPLPITIISGPNPTNVNLADVAGTATATGIGASNAGTQRVAVSSDSSLASLGNITGTISLPTGASTSANQTTANTSLASILANQTNGTQETNIVGTVPLPTGAATSANQTNGGQKTQVVDGADVTVGPVQTIAGTNYFPVVLAASATSGSALASRSIQIAGSDGTNARTISTDTSGNQNVNIVNTPAVTISGVATAANQTNGNQKTQIVDGTGAVAGNFVTLSGTNYFPVVQASAGPVTPGTAALKSTLVGMVYDSTVQAPTNGQQLAMQSDQFGNLQGVLPDQIITGQSTQTATVNNILTATAGSAASQVNNYKSAAVQVVSTGTTSGGTYIFEASNDNINFQSIPVYNQLLLTGAAITTAITATTGSSLIYTFPIHFNYVRLRIATTITGGGSIQAFTRFSQHAWTPASFQVAQNTSANLATTTTLQAGAAVVGATAVAIPLTVADVVSAALTTTTTTAAFTPASGSSYVIDIPVTVVSGTNPTLSVAVQESADAGTNWYTVYTFPLITTTGSYTSPTIMLGGNRVRYVQTVTGTTPSFTRAVNRLQSNVQIPNLYRNIIDTTINPTSTNSVTPSLFVENMNMYTAVVNQGSGGSAVTFALDGSDDNVNWIPDLARCIGVTGGATPVKMSYSGSSFRFIRARIVTGVAATTITNVSLIGAMGTNQPLVTQSILTDGSGTTSGTPSTSTQIFAANPVRKYLLIQNLGLTTIYINFTSAANATSSIALAPGTASSPGGSYVMESNFVSTEVVNVFSTGTSIAFMAKQG